ncbi:hypothetical protein AVEN_195442-1 [Araneus ventricosus]|uniref:Uncharacterized protein n=1 Tax=Araneus ventricosus TaxID=182803 RepID=A0A4Y2I2I7_ARAVE|nr:hypothetical protein AVEN_195442-1 [Araneus ventricosus]
MALINPFLFCGPTLSGGSESDEFPQFTPTSCLRKWAVACKDQVGLSPKRFPEPHRPQKEGNCLRLPFVAAKEKFLEFNEDHLARRREG